MIVTLQYVQVMPIFSVITDNQSNNNSGHTQNTIMFYLDVMSYFNSWIQKQSTIYFDYFIRTEYTFLVFSIMHGIKSP